MSDLVKRLWESDAASALTNEAARRIEQLERELAQIKSGQWFYPADGYESESCFYSPSEVLEEVYFWDRAKSGAHLVEINVATSLPSIWTLVTFDCQCNVRDDCDCDCDNNMVVQQFSSKAEAEAAYRKARGME